MLPICDNPAPPLPCLRPKDPSKLRCSAEVDLLSRSLGAARDSKIALDSLCKGSYEVGGVLRTCQSRTSAHLVLGVES